MIYLLFFSFLFLLLPNLDGKLPPSLYFPPIPPPSTTLPKRSNGPRPTTAVDGTIKPKKPRKTTKAKETPEGMSNADWVKLVARRKVENDSRRDRERKDLEKQEALERAEEKCQAQVSAYISDMYSPHHSGQFFPGGVWGSYSSASPTQYTPSLAHYTPSLQAMFHKSGAHTMRHTRFSPPEYEGGQLGSFNPNTIFHGCLR